MFTAQAGEVKINKIMYICVLCIMYHNDNNVYK